MTRRTTPGRGLTLALAILLSALGGASAQDFYQVFGPDKADLCRDTVSYYAIETSAQLTSTNWTIIPGASAILVNPDTYSTGVSFFSPGNYVLIALSTTVNGVTLIDSVFIDVIGLDIRPEVIGCYVKEPDDACYSVCAFSHTIVSLPNPGSNAEIIVTGADDYVFLGPASVDITWGAGGTGHVTFQSAGCSYDLCFDILPQPVAAFTTQPTAINDTIVVCQNQLFTFENTSSNGLTYTWSFGDGTSDTGFDAAHAYPDAGFYTVTLAAAGICDCRDEASVVVSVLPAPAPELDCVNSVCPETRQRYTATPAGCATYLWTVSANGTVVNGGGPADDFIEIIWHEGPDGYISLAVDGCATAYCSFTNVFRIPIISPEGPVAGDASVCAGELSTYTAPDFPGAVYAWTVGPSGTIVGDADASAVVVKWDDVNAVTSSWVMVSYDNCFLGCGGEDVLSVQITPEIGLTGDLQVCQNDMGSVSAFAGFGSPSPASVIWSLVDPAGNVVATSGPSTTWNLVFAFPPGLYTWVAHNASAAYCTETASLQVEVTATPATPLGILGERTICPGQQYGYTVDAAGTYGSVWTITDGAGVFTYNGQSCAHTFGPTPPYAVSVRHTDVQYAACMSDPVTITLGTVAGLAIAGPDEGCLNAIDTFTTDYVNGVDYVWSVIPADHGEIRSSDLNTVRVFWTQPGMATLRLQVCGVTIDHPFIVNALPTFGLTGPLAACPGATVTVSTDQPTYAHAWADELGGLISGMASANLMPGAYSVAVTDGKGCVTEKTFAVTAHPQPEVHLSSPVDVYHCNLIPAGVEIYANTDGAGYQFSWFQDGNALAASGPTYTVVDFGTYQVSVTNSQGCTTVSDPITYVNCCPPANCGINLDGMFPLSCTFFPVDFLIDIEHMECDKHRYVPMLSGIAPGQTTWFIQSVSRGILDVVQVDTLTYAYDKPGYYLIEVVSSLTGWPYGLDECGHYEKFVDTVPAVADFRHEGVCAGATIAFEDLTTFLPGETISSWAWDFGDPASGAANVSAVQHPSHVYANPGNYTVTLTVTMASGCYSIRTATIGIDGGPALGPVYDPIFCVNEAQAFSLSGELFDIQWDFGDPSSGPENTAGTGSVFHTFAATGTYVITVSAANILGCVSTTSLSVDIVPNGLAGLIDVDPLMPLCAGDTAVLTAPAGGTTWLWNTGETTPIIEVAASDQYGVLIRDAFGCTYSPPPVFVAVLPKPEVIIRAREILGPDMYGPWTFSLSLCEGQEFELSAFSTGTGSWNWTTGEVTQVIQFTDESGNLPGPGLHEYGVQVTDLANGCVSDSAIAVVEIFPMPDAPVIVLVSGSACSHSDNILSVSNPEPGVTYLWSDGQTGQSITVTDAGPYYVEASNANGCSLVSNILTIEPSAPVDRIPGGCFIACDPLTVCLPTLPGAVSYVLFRDGLQIDSGSGFPSSITIDQDGSYTFEVTSANGCVATSDPLDVALFTGVGSITVETWLDQDGDGMISAGDVLLPGIGVQIVSDDGMHQGNTETVPGGQFVFEDFPATGYTALIDRSVLPSQWTVLIDSVHTNISTCDDSVVVALLLTANCISTGPDVLIEACPGDTVAIGDSTWAAPGVYEAHLPGDSGCDSVFMVTIISPDSILITAEVWMDVDRSGTISPADTLLPGITIVFEESMSGTQTTSVTDNGGLAYSTLPDAPYDVRIDTALLPPQIGPLIWEAVVADSVCGNASVSFLVEPSCPSVYLIQPEILCPGDSLLVQGVWISDPGSHTFTISDPLTGCDTILEVVLSNYPALSVSGVVDWNCIHQGSIDLALSGVPPLVIDWQPGGMTDSMIVDLAEGIYMVKVTDGNGCTSAEQFDVVASTPLSFSLPPVYTVTEGDSVWLSISGDVMTPGLSFMWMPPGILSCPSCPDTWAFPLSDTTVTVLITDADSCTYALETRLIVEISDLLYIPNVFSPNGDGINDRWRFYTRYPEAFVHELHVFDRWGDHLFSKTDFALDSFTGWDGTFRGKPVNPGVFAYVARLTLSDGRTLDVKGDVTLLR